jgi:nucleotide-binding universal stress UspA family protein
MKSLLCAIDGSEYSTPAIDLAAELAGRFNAELTLLVVNELVSGYGRTGEQYHWSDDVVDDLLAKATTQVQAAKGPEPKKIIVKSRDVARAISMYAEDKGIDHIVLGTGGKGKVTRLLLGSVSQDVAARAHCPVTIAR